MLERLCSNARRSRELLTFFPLIYEMIVDLGT